MGFMIPWITRRADLWTIDCPDCGASCYWHDHADQHDRCPECGHTLPDRNAIDPDTDEPFWHNGGPHYAGRYTAPGYMDCTDWSYDRSSKALAEELEELYGEGNDDDAE